MESYARTLFGPLFSTCCFGARFESPVNSTPIDPRTRYWREKVSQHQRNKQKMHKSLGDYGKIVVFVGTTASTRTNAMHFSTFAFASKGRRKTCIDERRTWSRDRRRRGRRKEGTLVAGIERSWAQPKAKKRRKGQIIELAFLTWAGWRKNRIKCRTSSLRRLKSAWKPHYQF